MNALDSAFSHKNLVELWRCEKHRLRQSAFGVDRKSGKDFESNLKLEFSALRAGAREGRVPSGLLAIAKPKDGGGNRIICVPTIADRFFQFALLAECRSDLNDQGLLNPVSYGLARGCNRGVADARKAAVQLRTAKRWVLKADIQKFFDNIPREAVREVGERIIRKRSLRKPLLSFLETEISDGFDPDWRSIVAQAGIKTGIGVRQGMPMSPYYAGMVLLGIDREITRRKFTAIRYVDDIVGFFDSREECQSFASFLTDWLGQLGLSIGIVGGDSSKTHIYEPQQAVPFLGMELAWRVGAGFQLRITQKCIQNIGAKFAEMGSIDRLLTKGVKLPKVGKLLDEMSRGYIQAYDGAQNLPELTKEVNAMKDFALLAVLEETFGEKIHDLDKRRRNFIGIGELEVPKMKGK